jgi:general secretion pathway protein J
MMTAAYHREGGFTLVEMLVALSIFAVLAASGVGLLRSSVDTQNAVAARLSGSSGLTRLQALLANDVAHAIVAAESAAGKGQGAFAGNVNGFTLLRSGWDNLDGAPRSDVQRVDWTAAAGAVERAGSVPGTAAGTAAKVIAAKQARFRYRTAAGAWADSFGGAPGEPLPQAVELVLTPEGRPPVTIVLALPPRGIDGAPVPADPVLVPAA